jgi:SAM-dependent methyltransferase
VSFYADLSGVYDELFPVSDAQRELFGRILEQGEIRRVADAGCGSGAQLLHFASAGVSCVGFDPDPSLVAIAREKLLPYPGARIEVGGFADTARLVSPAVDLLLCLGNSLVHVPQAETARFVADAASVLSPGGRFLLQILNYERLLREGITELPLMTSGEGSIEFRRRYLWEGPRNIRFQTSLRIAGGDGVRVLRNEIPLYPIYPDELWETLAGAGFASIKYFGDFRCSDFHPDSEALVCLARKA